MTLEEEIKLLQYPGNVKAELFIRGAISTDEIVGDANEF